MIQRLQSTIKDKFPALAALSIVLLIWELLCLSNLIPGYMLPSPGEVAKSFVGDFGLLIQNAKITLQEAAIGLSLGIIIGFIFAVVMERFTWLYRAAYPLLVLTQTIPTVAIAPLLVLWFGYEIIPKVILIVIVTFFPITVGLLDGFKAVDKDEINLLRSMGANNWNIFRYIKCPAALPQFFSGLKIAASYSIVGAVISEWLGGFGGLGVYMIRVKKAFAFDKMFAVIFLISLISLLLIALINIIQRRAMPYSVQSSSQNESE